MLHSARLFLKEKLEARVSSVHSKLQKEEAKLDACLQEIPKIEEEIKNQNGLIETFIAPIKKLEEQISQLDAEIRQIEIVKAKAFELANEVRHHLLMLTANIKEESDLVIGAITKFCERLVS